MSCAYRYMNVYEPIPRAGAPAIGRFTGDNAAFRRLVTRGALLELVTFGFYRFWLATDIRRHLWSNTEVDGDALEYTGRGKELLLGFLIAMAVLVPVFLAYFLAGLAFERYKAFASLPLYAFLYLFGQFAVYRARRYRLTRTIWRGIRFWMTGSGWAYAVRALLWGLLLIPTLGFAYPWRTAALERYKLGHSFYGNLPGRFALTGWALFKRVWWVWLLGLLPVILLFGGLLAAGVATNQGLPKNNPLVAGSGIVMIVGLSSMLALPFLHAVRVATEWRWWAEGVRFGDAAVACVLPSTALIGVYWSLIGVGLLVVVGFCAIGGGLAGLVAAGIGHARFAGLASHPPVWTFAAYGVWYLGLLLTLGVIGRIYTLAGLAPGGRCLRAAQPGCRHACDGGRGGGECPGRGSRGRARFRRLLADGRWHRGGRVLRRHVEPKAAGGVPPGRGPGHPGGRGLRRNLALRRDPPGRLPPGIMLAPPDRRAAGPPGAARCRGAGSHPEPLSSLDRRRRRTGDIGWPHRRVVARRRGGHRRGDLVRRAGGGG